MEKTGNRNNGEREISRLLGSAENILNRHIYPFWLSRVVDREYGGFYGRVDLAGNPVMGAPKGLVLNGRLLWGYSRAYRYTGNKEFLSLADRAYDYLADYFYDRRSGGFYWMLNGDGSISVDTKMIYGQAFAVYSLSEYYGITKKERAAELAGETVRLMEEKTADRLHGGYGEAFAADWSVPSGMRVSPEGVKEEKAQNSHLHILEAYSNYQRYVSPVGGKDLLREIVRIVTGKIIRNDSPTLGIYFRDDWTEIDGGNISCGHDIEGSWLLWEALELLGDEALKAKWRPVIDRINTACLGYFHEKGGMVFEIGREGGINRERHWWVQAEGAIGFLNAFQMSEDTVFLDKTCEIWDFIEREFVNKDTGEWRGYALSDKKIYPCLADEWKGFYHNSRACIEIIERCRQLLNHEGEFL